MQQHNIIIRPVITEKSMHNAGQGKFTFAVAKDADKTTIKNAVEKTYKVSVVDVATALVKGRTKRVGQRRNEIVESSWKKAVVKLKSGEKIGLFDTGA